MGQHRLQLVVVEPLHDARRHSHHSILLISAGSKGIGHAGLNYGNLGHGQIGIGTEPGYDLMKLWRFALRDDLRAHGGQDHLAGKEIL